MAITYQEKKRKQNNIIYSIITAILICAMFLAMVVSFYLESEDEAYEMLHIQTKQIKDNLTLQLKSDRENLSTMANFASKLYADGKGYERMFDSFKPIGLFSRIGILNPDGSFITKDGVYDLSGKISFEEQARLGEYVTGRTYSYSIPDEQVLRSSVPIKVNGETVGIIYGIINIQYINEKYNEMAKAINAQLFVYDKENAKFIIDTIEKNPGELAQLRTREYRDGASFNDFLEKENGFLSFKSILKGENLYVHYSAIEDFNWGIILGRYESQVFDKTNRIFRKLLIVVSLMLLIILGYLQLILSSEKTRTRLNAAASSIRKLLLEINQNTDNVKKSLETVVNVSKSRSAFFRDMEDEEYNYLNPEFESEIVTGEDRKYFAGELFRYATEFKNVSNTSAGVLSIVPNKHLQRTNSELYNFFKSHNIKRVTLAVITHNNNKNNVSILGIVNPKNAADSRTLVEDVAVCFSIAIFNKNHLNKTYTDATTDALTGAMNRVAYKKDCVVFDNEKPENFTCIYIDVNELHLRNNKYGHAAGDEMLVYIANTLKGVFYGHSIYRMGGDEFLVFAKNTERSHIKNCIDVFIGQLQIKGYKVAIGMSYRTENPVCEEMVREAEKRMYESKAQYYQNKEQISVPEDVDKEYIHIKTGIREIDATISVLKKHYNGIYKVSLDTDTAHRILMPAYLGYNEDESNFSKLLSKYIDEIVHPDFHRPVISFLNYDAIKSHIKEGKTPSITYKKVNGEMVNLSVYKLAEDKEDNNDTLWVFAKE